MVGFHVVRSLPPAGPLATSFQRPRHRAVPFMLEEVAAELADASFLRPPAA
jgi:hypothetical protein